MKTNLVNIYKRQMKKLNVNPRQYAKLLNVPYEVVLEIIYNKGSDNMEMNEFYRNTMLEKHQEIEKNIDNVKVKALEFNHEEIEKLKTWYEQIYTQELLLKVTQTSSTKEFRNKYKLIVYTKEASKWFYDCICNKNFVDRINKNVFLELVRQLHDIIVNKNSDKYKREITLEDELAKSDNLFIWHKDFDYNRYFKENNLNKKDVAEETGIAYSILCQIISKSYFSNKSVKKLKDYIELAKSECVDDVQTITTDLPEMNIEKERTPINKIKNSNDDIMKKILISRLTDEDKMLIELFGGKIC